MRKREQRHPVPPSLSLAGGSFGIPATASATPCQEIFLSDINAA
jgi:hypothetical protein